MSPCDQVKGLQIFPNLLLFIPQRDARTAARIRMYIAKLVCCVPGPLTAPDAGDALVDGDVASGEGPQEQAVPHRLLQR
jgi:hypothetical protein